MVVVFNIIDSQKIIDKEITELDNKSNKDIDDLYAKELEKSDPKVNFLYQIFEKEYKNKLFIENLLLLLKKYKFPISYLSFVDDIDYIKNFGYNGVNQIGKGAFGTVYLAKKNKNKYAIKMQKFNDYYREYLGGIEKFLEQNITEYEKLKKLNKYSISPKVYDIKFVFNKNKMELYSFIFMEHLNGITLEEYKQKKGQLDDSDKKKLNEKIDKLHKLGIYHRDLHDRNIIVIKKGKKIDFMIIDMGLAKSTKNILNNANKFNKFYIEEDFKKKPDENNKLFNKLYIAIANSVKKGQIDVILS
jgi:tRNA A-37 threonylcarbamoyl transferase component Bud32